MATPANANEFLELIRKSGVADDKRLEAYLQKANSAGAIPRDAASFEGADRPQNLSTSELSAPPNEAGMGRHGSINMLPLLGQGRLETFQPYRSVCPPS